MILKEKKLSIVMAFILGTTMLSSVDKAWCMDDGNDLSKKQDSASSSHVTVAPRFFLAGTARVSEETREVAQKLVDAFGDNPEISKSNKNGRALRKSLIEGGSVLRKDKDMATFFRSLARVMADLDSEQPGLASSRLVTLSLETITLAVNEDPYDRITRGESKPVISADKMDSIRQSLLKAKQDAKLSDFFSAELPKLVDSHSTIVDSLMARYPREEEKIEQQRRRLNIYFGQNNPVEPQKAAAPQSTRRRNQRQLEAERLRQLEAERQRQEKRQEEFDKKLNTLAEAFYLLKQINDRSTPSSSSSSSSSSAPIQLEALTASSSSTLAVTPLELEIREFHMGKSTPYPSTGFSAYEGSHRWTVGKKATISFSDMNPRPSHVSFLNTGGFVTASHPQNLTVKVNGDVVDRYEYTPSNNNQTIDIDLPKTGPAEIEFEIPTAISPSELVGTNPDTRELGILFKEVHFQY